MILKTSEKRKGSLTKKAMEILGKGRLLAEPDLRKIRKRCIPVIINRTPMASMRIPLIISVQSYRIPAAGLKSRRVVLLADSL